MYESSSSQKPFNMSSDYSSNSKLTLKKKTLATTNKAFGQQLMEKLKVDEDDLYSRPSLFHQETTRVQTVDPFKAHCFIVKNQSSGSDSQTKANDIPSIAHNSKIHLSPMS